MIGRAIFSDFDRKKQRSFFTNWCTIWSIRNTVTDVCLWSRYFQNEKKKEIFLMLVQIICSYTSAELEAFLQHITIMMNRRTRTNAPKAEAQIMTASSHVITLSVQWVPSYRKNSSCVHLTKETEFVWICCCLYFA